MRCYSVRTIFHSKYFLFQTSKFKKILINDDNGMIIKKLTFVYVFVYFWKYDYLFRSIKDKFKGSN